MRDYDGATVVSAIDVRSQEMRQGSREGRKLGSTKKVEEEEDCEDEDKSESGKRRVDEDGGKKHDDHHSMENFASSVHLYEGSQAEYDAKAYDKDADAIEAYEKADIRSTETLQFFFPAATLPIFLVRKRRRQGNPMSNSQNTHDVPKVG